MSYGQDQTVVFTRNSEEMEVNKDMKSRFASTQLFFLRGNKKHKMLMSHVQIGFCGKTYRAIEVQIFDSNESVPVHSFEVANPVEVKYCYDIETLREFLAGYKFQINMNEYSWQPELEPVIKNFLKRQGTEENMEWLIENKIAIMIYYGYEAWRGSGRFLVKKQDTAVLNPVLKDVEFYKVLDSFTAYQELDMFISGTLPQSTAMPIEIADKDKIPQHGFDKWSFRKMPEGK
jgi:hypothetical protein